MQVNKQIIKDGAVFTAAIFVGGIAFKKGCLAFEKFVPKAISKIHLTTAVASAALNNDDEDDDDDDYDY